MGLDMHLLKTKRVPGLDKEVYEQAERAIQHDTMGKEVDENYKLDLTKLIDHPKAKELKPFYNKAMHFSWWTLMEEVAYWRKANQIHKWFVDNVQGGADDCKLYEVKREHLDRLLYICKQVESSWDSGVDLLPVQEGFFFGSNEYDERYKEDIIGTIDQITVALEEVDFDRDILFYQSSW